MVVWGRESKDDRKPNTWAPFEYTRVTCRRVDSRDHDEGELDRRKPKIMIYLCRLKIIAVAVNRQIA